MSTDGPVPALFARLVDDAAVFPPGNAVTPAVSLPSATLASRSGGSALDRSDAAIADALAAHATHRAAWYADLVGPLLLPASALPRLPEAPLPRFGVIGDTGLAGVHATFEAASALARTHAETDPAEGQASGQCAQFEVAVAKRGEDPQPGLRTLLAAAGVGPDLDVYAEVPLTWGLLDALDTLAAERATGARVAPKFRTGGLAAELFPTPVELAAVICACRDRDLPFKLTAGLHRALRNTDAETGFTHHGFVNVLAATLAAADGAEVADVAELLGNTDPLPVVEAVRVARAKPRPLWIGYGSCSIREPVSDLTELGLLGLQGVPHLSRPPLGSPEGPQSLSHPPPPSPEGPQ